MGDCLPHSRVDRGEIFSHDVAAAPRKKDTGVDVAPAINRDVRKASHHAPRVFRRLRVGHVVDDRVIPVLPRGPPLSAMAPAGCGTCCTR